MNGEGVIRRKVEEGRRDEAVMTGILVMMAASDKGGNKQTEAGMGSEGTEKREANEKGEEAVKKTGKVGDMKETVGCDRGEWRREKGNTYEENIPHQPPKNKAWREKR